MIIMAIKWFRNRQKKKKGRTQENLEDKHEKKHDNEEYRFDDIQKKVDSTVENAELPE